MLCCFGCLCPLQVGRIPLCQSCYEELLKLPIEIRAARLSDIMQSHRQQAFQDMVVEQLARFVDIVEKSQQDEPPDVDEADAWKYGRTDDDDI